MSVRRKYYIISLIGLCTPSLSLQASERPQLIGERSLQHRRQSSNTSRTGVASKRFALKISCTAQRRGKKPRALSPAPPKDGKGKSMFPSAPYLLGKLTPIPEDKDVDNPMSTKDLGTTLLHRKEDARVSDQPTDPQGRAHSMCHLVLVIAVMAAVWYVYAYVMKQQQAEQQTPKRSQRRP